MKRPLLFLLTAATLASSVLSSSCGPVGGQRYTRKQAAKSFSRLEKPGVEIGEFRLTKVVDGDTIKVDGLDASLRLVGIDTEETFKNEADRRAVETDWQKYLKDKRGSSRHPVKIASPLGEQAKLFAKEWFAGIDKVKLQRDDPAEIRDRYNRYLAYVLAQKNGVWQVYNVEVVRAGMAPYFPKYGFSRLYHKEFLAAQVEAKAAHRGIWAPGAMAAPDYPEREAWWMARGTFIEEFRKEGEGNPAYIDITHWDSMKQLEEHLGKEVHILATVDDVVVSGKGPARAMLSHTMRSGFPLIFFDRDVLGTTGLEQWKGEFVVVTGTPTFYENKVTHKKQLQIQIERASQIKLSPVPGLTPPAAAAAPVTAPVTAPVATPAASP
jgi:endonuclease YncB( thermonuclease family)